MLSGKVPFQPKQYTNHSAQIIMKNIMCGEVTFEGDEWNGVSHSAKNLIQGMQNYSCYWKVLTGKLWTNSFACCIIPAAGNLTSETLIEFHEFQLYKKHLFLQRDSKIFAGQFNLLYYCSITSIILLQLTFNNLYKSSNQYT